MLIGIETLICWTIDEFPGCISR